MTEAAYFTRTGETFTPLPIAASLWSSDQIHGVAVSGLIAKAIEDLLIAQGRAELVPARYRVDLFRAARNVPSWVTTTIVREGPRIVLIDAEFHQHAEQDGVTIDRVVARGSATFLKSGDQPTGPVWSGSDRGQPPPLEVAPVSTELRLPLWRSASEWSTEFGQHQNAGRHETWQTPVPTVLGEPMTPFNSVAAIADTASMIANWGEAGVEWINTDLVITLSRRPLTGELGMRAIDRVSADGVAAGVAEVFDRGGTFGTVTVSALANVRRTVNFTDDPHHVEGAGFSRPIA